jgi:hypothetical protein
VSSSGQLIVMVKTAKQGDDGNRGVLAVDFVWAKQSLRMPFAIGV